MFFKTRLDIGFKLLSLAIKIVPDKDAKLILHSHIDAAMTAIRHHALQKIKDCKAKRLELNNQ